MTTLTIKLPEEMRNRLEIEARQQGVSMSALIRQLLVARLHDGEGKPSLYERTRDLCGAGASGVADLATNPAYLEGLGR